MQVFLALPPSPKVRSPPVSLPPTNTLYTPIHPSIRATSGPNVGVSSGILLLCGDYKKKNSPLATNIGQLIVIELHNGEQHGQIKNFPQGDNAWQLLLNSRSGLKTADKQLQFSSHKVPQMLKTPSPRICSTPPR